MSMLFNRTENINEIAKILYENGFLSRTCRKAPDASDIIVQKYSPIHPDYFEQDKIEFVVIAFKPRIGILWEKLLYSKKFDEFEFVFEELTKHLGFSKKEIRLTKSYIYHSTLENIIECPTLQHKTEVIDYVDRVMKTKEYDNTLFYYYLLKNSEIKLFDCYYPRKHIDSKDLMKIIIHHDINKIFNNIIDDINIQDAMEMAIQYNSIRIIKIILKHFSPDDVIKKHTIQLLSTNADDNEFFGKMFRLVFKNNFTINEEFYNTLMIKKIIKDIEIFKLFVKHGLDVERANKLVEIKLTPKVEYLLNIGIGPQQLLNLFVNDSC